MRKTGPFRAFFSNCQIHKIQKCYNKFVKDIELKPTKAELSFLNLAYARFYKLFDIITSDTFFSLDKTNRFFYIKDIILVYSELLSYEPISYEIMLIKKSRPPMEAEISKDLLKFIRNILTHFPLFTYWNEVWINKELVNWSKCNDYINSFLQKYSGHKQVKYRIWIAKQFKMIYIDINFPDMYDESKIFLKDIISEKKGVIFLCYIMKKILDSQLMYPDTNS